MATESAGSSSDTVSIVDSNGGPIPECQNVPLQAGGSGYQAGCTTSFSSAGTHQLQAYFYSGGMPTGHTASLSYTVSGAATSTSLSSSISSPTPGQPFLLTATITSSSSAPIAGTVEFSDGGSPISGCSSQSVGESAPNQPPFRATCQLQYPSAGSHTFVATYSGDSSNQASTSAPLSLTVRPIGSGQLAVCPGQDQKVTAASLLKGRAAAVCLLNEVRDRYGLSALQTPPGLAAYAQARPGAGTFPRPAGASAASALFDNVGDQTPYAYVAALMRSRQGCFDVLTSTQAGVGLVTRAVIPSPPRRGAFAFAVPPSWTLLLVRIGGIANPTAAGNCPHPLPVDAAGQGAPPSGARTDLAVSAASITRRSLALAVTAQSSKRVSATLRVRIGSFSATARVNKIRRGSTHSLRLRLSPSARRSVHPGVVVSVIVNERSPRHATYLFRLRL